MRALIVFLIFSTSVMAQENRFDQGLKAYQAKDWQQARDNFEKALQQQPGEAAIFYNLGLTYFQMGQKGYAIGYWRKALAAAPGMSAAVTALERIEDKYHFSRLEKSPWASAAHDLFQRLDWNIWLLALAIFLTLSGTGWLRFFAKRKTALASESEEAPSIGWGQLLLTVFFVLALAGVTGKFLDQEKPRATVVTTAAEIKSAPSKDGVTLSSIAEGSEVAIVRDHGDWVQVNTGEGSGGWMAKADLLPANKASQW